ncbi:MAG: hypothetical protein RSC72_11150 [Algoriella sp.]|uniref:hypothetical protein n=1 Tax=Algoriella sp. TaxID=1872434 RepID=UPI002FC911FB
MKILVTIESLHFNYPGVINPNIPPRLFGQLLNKGKLEIEITVYNKIKEKTEKYIVKDNLLKETARLNNLGIGYEKNNNIDLAIETYLENIKLGYPARHSYNRLIILYTKNKEFNKALEISVLAIKKFPKETKYKEKRDKLKLKIKTDIK